MAVPFAAPTVTVMVTVWPASGSLTVTLPVAWTVAVVAALPSPTTGGWFGIAATSTVTVAVAHTVGVTVLQIW